MARRRRRKHDVIFLVAAALLIAFIWGAFEYIDPVADEPPSDDADGDGLLDEWEMTQFGNLDQTADGDPDNDGQTNLQEYNANTDPNVAPPPPPPENLTFPVWVFDADVNHTFNLSVNIDGVELFFEKLTLDKQNLGNYMALEGNHTVNITALNDTIQHTFERTLEFTDGMKLILEVWEYDAYIWLNDTVPISASCGV